MRERGFGSAHKGLGMNQMTKRESQDRPLGYKYPPHTKWSRWGQNPQNSVCDRTHRSPLASDRSSVRSQTTTLAGGRQPVTGRTVLASDQPDRTRRSAAAPVPELSGSDRTLADRTHRSPQPNVRSPYDHPVFVVFTPFLLWCSKRRSAT
jgi:hypothetical protein